MAFYFFPSLVLFPASLNKNIPLRQDPAFYPFLSIVFSTPSVLTSCHGHNSPSKIISSINSPLRSNHRLLPTHLFLNILEMILIKLNTSFPLLNNDHQKVTLFSPNNLLHFFSVLPHILSVAKTH